MPANSLPRAAALLDEVQAAVLRRDYTVLAGLSATLEAELDRPSQPLDAAALVVIKQKADRNAATLLAVKRGINAALRRISEIKSVANGLVTYDRSGRKAENTIGQGLAARF